MVDTVYSNRCSSDGESIGLNDAGDGQFVGSGNQNGIGVE
jgi:hypothetical protein